MHSHTSQMKSENKEAKLQFCQHHYYQYLDENDSPNDNFTYDMNVVIYNITGDKKEYRIFKDVIANHCLMNDFVFTTNWYKQ